MREDLVGIGSKVEQLLAGIPGFKHILDLSVSEAVPMIGFIVTYIMLHINPLTPGAMLAFLAARVAEKAQQRVTINLMPLSHKPKL